MRHLLKSARFGQLSWTFVDQCIVSGSNFLIGVAVARALGLEQFGIFTLGMLVVWLAQGLNNGLVFAPMLSVAPKQARSDWPGYFGAVLVHQAVAVVLFGGATLVAAHLLHLQALRALKGDVLLAAIASGAALICQEFLRRYFYAKGQPQMAAFNSALSNALQAAALVALYLSGHFSVAHVFAAAGCGSALAVAINAPRILPLSFDSVAFRQITRRHWNIARWLMASFAAYWLSGNLFYLAAGATLGPAAVGAMRAATLVLAVGNLVMQGLDNYLPVRVAQALQRDGKAGALREATRVGLVSVAIITAISLVLCAAPEFWMRLFFGARYHGYGWLIVPFAVLNPLTTLITVCSGLLRAFERTRFIFVTWAIMACFSLATSTAIVQRFGLSGAAWGVTAMQGLGVLIMAPAIFLLMRHPAPRFAATQALGKARC